MIIHTFYASSDSNRKAMLRLSWLLFLVSIIFKYGQIIIKDKGHTLRHRL